MAHGCFFLICPSSADRSTTIEARIRALVSFYAPLGAAPQRVQLARGATFVAGFVEIGEQPPDTSGASDDDVVGWWLEPPPSRLSSASELLDADDAALRELSTGLVFAASGNRCRVVTAPSGPTSLYRAVSTEFSVWSTHAVAAGYLAAGHAEADLQDLPVLTALDFLPGRCLVAGVQPVEPATRIDVTARGVDGRSYWPASARLEVVPADEAYAFTRDALLTTLDQRLALQPKPRLGLTAGLDSRVVAAAARCLAIDLHAFTWEIDASDVAGARAAAGRFEIPHEVVSVHAQELYAGVREMTTWLRWADGLGPMTPMGVPGWPAESTAFVTGAGGEVGRAFWWRQVGANYRSPSEPQLRALFRPDLRLPYLPRQVRMQIRAATARMMTDATDAGLRGWAVLDGMYAEHRLTSWGRSMLLRPGVSTIGAFLNRDVLRGLLSLSHADKTTDGFHRRFLGECNVSIPPPPATQREGVPAVVRRAAQRARRMRHAPLRATAPLDPGYRHWLADNVLRTDVVAERFGHRFSDQISEALIGRASAAAAEAAVTLTGPVLLREALAELPRIP